MSIVTSHLISKLYETYVNQEILITKDVSRTLLLNTKGIHIRCLGYQWPCIIYSSSLNTARVIVNTKSGLKQVVEKANKMVILNFSFLQREKQNPISIFMKGRVTGYAPYTTEKPDLNFMNIEFANRPPDDLIHRLGELMDAQTKAHERRDERIVLSAESFRELRIAGKDAFGVSIEGIPRKCIVRDISFGGAKVIIFGVPTFLVNKSAKVSIRFEDPDEVITINGTVLRFEEVQGRKDLAAFAIQFEEDQVPSGYKLRLSNYLKSQKTKKSTS